MEITDIIEEIVQHLHPYHITLYLTINKKHYQLLREWKYNIVQRWICPLWTLEQAKNMFPILSSKDVVELALFYNPIPESMGKFDNFSLFYHACRTNSTDPTIFCEPDPSDISVMGWICYKFGRLDVITKLSNMYPNHSELLIIVDIIKLRINPKANVVYHHYKIHILFLIEAAIYLLDRDELLEVVVIASGLVLNKVLFNYLLDPNSQQFTEQFLQLDEVNLLVDSLVTIYGWPYIQNIVRKYYPYCNIPQIFPQHNGSNHYWKPTSKPKTTNFDHFLHPQQVNALSANQQLIFHLTRGDYISYMILRNSGVEMIVDNSTIVGTNNCGYISFNKNFQTTFNAYVSRYHGDSTSLIIDINDDSAYLCMSPLEDPWIVGWI